MVWMKFCTDVNSLPSTYQQPRSFSLYVQLSTRNFFHVDVIDIGQNATKIFFTQYKESKLSPSFAKPQYT